MFLAAAAAAQNPAVPRHEAPIPYVIQAGDTPSQLAERYIVPERTWRDLLRLVQSRDPRRLPRGRTLSIPRSWLRWTPEQARVVSARGTVTLSSGGRQLAPEAGTVLGEGAEIVTAANSFVTLSLSDGSRVSLPSQSRVRVAMLRKYVINGAIDYRFDLQRGRIDSKAVPLKDASGNFIINTPLAMTAVRGTDWAVAYEGDATGTGVYEGAVAVSRPDGTGEAVVPEDFGALTDAQGNSRTVELLAAPGLVDPGRVQADELVTFELTPVEGAAGYQIVLAHDATLVDRFYEQRSATPRFEVPDVPNGNKAVRISAIAPSGLEGQRESFAFRRQLASVGAEAGEVPDGFAFKWFGSGEGARYYRLQIVPDAPEGTPIVDEVGLAGEEVLVRDLPPGVYYWRVGLTQFGPDGEIDNWTDPEKLTIAAPGG